MTARLRFHCGQMLHSMQSNASSSDSRFGNLPKGETKDVQPKFFLCQPLADRGDHGLDHAAFGLHCRGTNTHINADPTHGDFSSHKHTRAAHQGTSHKHTRTAHQGTSNCHAVSRSTAVCKSPDIRSPRDVPGYAGNENVSNTG